MKYSTQRIALLLISLQIVTIAFAKGTPQGADLANHYGTNLAHNKYGPKSPSSFNLRREGVGPGVPVTPISNYEKEINPKQVVAGDLDNTAFDASKIVSAQLAGPKAEIKSTIHHEAVVKTPMHVGNQYEENTVTTFNRVTGKVETKMVTTEKPILAIKNQIQNMKTEHTSVVDLTTGKLAASNAQKIFHGK